MKLSEFDYDLPKELIARFSLKERDQARLMVVDRAQRTITHAVFKDIVSYVRKGDLLALNDTKVRACRLKGRRKTGGKVEVMLLNRLHGLTFQALIKPGRLRVGERIAFDNPEVSCTITAKNEVAFEAKNVDEIYRIGVIPLPPYLKREAEHSDYEYYQTVYAKEEGSVASPTAGLHFTKGLMKEIESQGIDIAYLTLHIGYATFKPVKSDDIALHKMDMEYFKIRPDTQKLIEKTRLGNGRIIAVGTTSCRVLETFASGVNEGATDLFIYPSYRFKMVDCLLTNFHLPRTTLFMLVCAFMGTSFTRQAYQEAIKAKYRFYSYGDAMLIV
jgi:S-adenosylmethionine:tRNA ribosyltransferase-isomerase